MGGPVAGVILEKRPIGLENWVLETVRRIAVVREDNPFRFQVTDTFPIGGSYRNASGRPFYLERGHGTPTPLPADNYDASAEDATLRFVDAFSFWPETEMLFGSFSNSKDDHRILAEIILYIAERLDGVVDFGGILFQILDPIPENPFNPKHYYYVINEAMEALTPRTALPGKVVALPDYIMDKSTDGWFARWWAWHCSDTTFLRAWMQHPQFHMIK